MKIISTIIFAMITITVNAQTSLIPGKTSFEKKWIKDNSGTIPVGNERIIRSS